MALSIALARLIEVEFRPPTPLAVDAVPAKVVSVEAPPVSPASVVAIVAPTPAPAPAQVAPEPAPKPARTYVVKRGETLGTISKKVYGTSTKWKKIQDANRDVIPDPRKMRHGVVLRIPE